MIDPAQTVDIDAAPGQFRFDTDAGVHKRLLLKRKEPRYFLLCGEPNTYSPLCCVLSEMIVAGSHIYRVWHFESRKFRL
jgi:hypothetical protein